jgi:hypothetical protein
MRLVLFLTLPARRHPFGAPIKRSKSGGNQGLPYPSRRIRRLANVPRVSWFAQWHITIGDSTMKKLQILPSRSTYVACGIRSTVE